jgi:hypothetical protein
MCGEGVDLKRVSGVLNWVCLEAFCLLRLPRGWELGREVGVRYEET